MAHRALAVVVLLAAGLTVRAASPDQTPPPAGLILGRVVDAVSGAGVARAVVSLSPSASPGAVAAPLGTSAEGMRLVADAEGRFVFHGLAAGSYALTVTASGYVSGAYGQRRPNGPSQSFVLGDSQRVGDVTLRLWKQASVGGTVVDERGDPMVATSVTIMQWRLVGGRREVQSFSTARTDDRGMFRFSALTPGQFLLAVPSSVSNLPISVSQAYAGLAPGTNPSSSPLVQSLSASRSPSPVAGGVTVGDFLVPLTASGANSGFVAADAEGRIVAYPATFYPDAPTVTRASPITLAPGDDRSGVVVQLRPVRMASVSGTLMGPDGPMGNFGVRLESVGQDNMSVPSSYVEVGSTATDASGAFTFLAVPPGQFIARASRVVRPTTSLPPTTTVMSSGGVGGTVFTASAGLNVGPLPPDPTLWGETPVTVGDAPVRGVTLQLRTGLTMSGRIEFLGATPPPPERVQTLMLNFSYPSGQNSVCCPMTRVTADGAFSTQGSSPGLYGPNVGLPGWYLASITQGGRDVSQGGIRLGTSDVTDVTITMTDKPATVSGAVHASGGTTADEALVVVFPADYETWIADGASTRAGRATRPSRTGMYNFTGLVAGAYLVAAASEDDLVDWQEAATIKKLASFARRVTLAAGTPVTQDVTVGSIK